MSKHVSVTALVLATLFAILSARADAKVQEAIQGERIAAGVLDDGRLTALVVRDRDLLASPGGLWLTVDQAEPVRFGPAFKDFSARRQGRILAFQGRHPKLPVSMSVEWIGEVDIECRVRLSGEVKPRSTAHVELRLPLHPQTLEVLAPSGSDRQTVDFSKPMSFAFRGRGQSLVMPAVVLYQPKQDWGLTLMADFALPTRGFELALGDKAARLVMRRVDLRLEPGRPVEVSMILASHAGDWRPGLGHVLERNRQFFLVEDDRLPKLHGAFVCSGGAPPEATVVNWKAQRVRTVEVHGTIPFYGQHLPLGDRWTMFADDCWHRLRELADPSKPADSAPWREILAYVNRKVPPNISADMVRDYIRRLHAQGIYAIMYFNPTEAWKPWIKENYPEALVHTAAGQPIPVWYESYMVCPDPESRWGKHLLDEFSKMMDLYPEADGFFMDQSCYDNLDYAHDDGWSISQGRTGYRMGWAINEISRRCRAIAKPRGKFMWWNGPYNVNIARYAEGMMAEAGNEAQVRTIHYLTMGGRACCTLSHKGEKVFQNCAAYGLYPTAMGTSELARLADRYWPIFELFAGKQWIFHSRALELPFGTKGNIYRLPDGNVLAVVVTAGRSVDGPGFDLDLPLMIRLPDAERYRAAYFLSPDLLGKRRLKIARQKEGLRVVIPRHRSVSAVLLTKTEDKGEVNVPFERLVAQTCEAKLRETAEVRGRRLEFYVDRPLSAELVPPQESIPEGQPSTVRVAVFNAGPPRTVRVSLAGASIDVKPAEQAFPFPGRSRREVAFQIVGGRAGRLELVARAEVGTDRAESKGSFEVHATRASADELRRVRSGVLSFELAGSDGGKYKNKPVFLNGVRLDVLPSQGDHWGPAELPLPRAALATLGERNEVRIENTVGDAFKVRSFRLRLRRDDVVQIVSPASAQAYTSCGWEFAEGKVFKLKEPLKGIVILIPSR